MITIEKKKFKELYDMACLDWKIKFNKILQSFIFSDNLEFEESFVQEMKTACTKDQAPIFTKIFKDCIKQFDFTTIKTYKDVCYELGIEELDVSSFKFLPKEQQLKASAYHKIQNIVKLFNKGWVPDWNNSNQYKYYPWFEKRSYGWVFGVSGCRCGLSDGLPGCYFSREVSDYCGKTFIDIYKELL